MSSFALHSVQVQHTHHSGATSSEYAADHSHTSASAAHTHAATGASDGNGGESLADKMHLAEKKFVYFFIAATLLFFAFSQQLFYTRLHSLVYVRVRRLLKDYQPLLHSYLHRFYALGLLNPKPF